MNAQVNEIQVLEQNVIVAAFAQVGGTDELFERIAEQARSFVPDISTKKGRDAIGSIAAKVSSSKKLAEKYALDLVSEKKAEVKAVDNDRIQFCKKMDALRDEILAPRDAWVKAEEDRKAKFETAIETIKNYAANNFLITANSTMIEEAITSLNDQVIDSSFEDYEEKAKIAKFEALETLRNALTETKALEAERVELERLRKEQLEREQRERDERIAKEATEKATREAEEKARLEAERVEREKRESAEREARLQAEKEAALLREEQLKQQAIEREKQTEIDRQNAIEQERLRIEREQAEKAESERQAEAERMANVEHMRTINQEILNKLCEIGLDEGQAKAVITAIARNQIPNVSVKY
ncbi:MAG: hypothetical protein RR939_08920 [Acinetobacter sp.]